GLDGRLSFSSHTCLVQASKPNYSPLVNSSQTLTKNEEPTGILISWSNTNDITYSESTMLYVSYTMSNGTSITDAWVRVETGTDSWILTWDTDIQLYKLNFTELGAWPGLGVHGLEIIILDTSEALTIHGELGDINSYWIGDGIITFIESDTLVVNYTIADGSPISGATVNVTIDGTLWDLVWHPISETYRLVFNGTDNPPDLGSHVLEIRAWRFGFDGLIDSSLTLNIIDEPTTISVIWSNSDSITYFEHTYLFVRYFMSNGSDLLGASVNVTIDTTTWNLLWNSTQGAYGVLFSGWDTPPGLGSHSLLINATKFGFAYIENSAETLTLSKDPTTISTSWSNGNDITYVESTTLIVQYRMSNGTPIATGTVTATIGTDVWPLVWNATSESYYVVFDGDMSPPGLEIFSVQIDASGAIFATQSTSEPLTIREEPTTIAISWSNTNSITFVESTILTVNYTMSDGSPVTGATVNVTIVGTRWDLTWHVPSETYRLIFLGSDTPPGFGVHSLDIRVGKYGYVNHLDSTETLTLSEEPTSATAFWTFATIDWTKSIVLGIDYRDSYGTLIDGATQKIITIDGAIYILQGTNGTYWLEFDNSFNLGHHLVVVNISKYGYEFAVNSSISFDIVNANTDLSLSWDFTTIDYLGQIVLTADYTYTGTGDSIPVGLVDANITIDGITTLSLTPSGDLWTITLDGDYLDLGSHSVVVRAQAYGYNYAESSETLNVDEVSTISSGVTWTPSNLTIEYTNSLDLVVDYTYAGGDVPATAIVNVTIVGRLYELLYSAGAWRISIPGSDLGVGVFNADISAWLYGYELRTFVTSGINVTLAANSFVVTWEPWDLTPTYIDKVNLTVVYTEDFSPILDSTVRLYINGSAYDLTYSAIDEMWHFSIDAATIDLGVWNVTVTANKTGYADGYFTDILTVVVVPTTLSILDSGTTFYFDETTTVDIYYQLTNLSVVPSAVISFTLNSFEQTRIWSVDHWSATLNGTELGVGIYTYDIITSAHGYETQVDTIEITVLSIPTSIVQDMDVAIYAREFVSFR
ncbi:MAG: hypothetical protein ACW99G_21725, partial [Candidatus Thorarchaeota archaeon]